MKYFIFLFLLLFFCGKSDSPKQNTDQLTIISPHSKDIKDNFDKSFKAHYNKKFNKDIKINWLDQGGTSDDLRFIKSQFSKFPEKIGVDLFWGGGIAPHLDLKKQGLLTSLEIDSSIINGIPEELNGLPLYDGEYHWYGSCLSGFGIIYNRMVLNTLKIPEPKEWIGLVHKDYFDWISLPDIRHSGSIEMMFQIIINSYGWEKGWEVLTLMCANTKRFTLSSRDVIQEVTSGDAACALCVDYYAWKQIETYGKEKIGFALPLENTVINPDCISVVKGLENKKEAKAFLEFLLSEAGQKIYYLPKDHPEGPPISSLDRLPILPSVYEKYQKDSFIPINPFANNQSLDYDEEKSQLIWSIFKDLCGTLLIDAHTPLRNAWKSIQGDSSPEQIKTLSQPPVDSVQLYEMASKWTQDELFRNKTLNDWAKHADNKYNNMVKE